jgi:hypothetical protein
MMKKSNFKREKISFNKAILSLLFLLAIFFPKTMISQTQEDTVQITSAEKIKKPSIFSGRPGKSLLFSLVVPGAGQIYNKSYLRVPFVWAAVGGAGYFLVNTSRQYNAFRDAYINKIDMQPVSIDRWVDKHGEIPFTDFTAATLENAPTTSIRKFRDEANVNRQWAIIGFSLVWLANGIDAFVDAHLKDFDIDEDLSIDIGPRMDDDPFAPMRMGIYMQF